MMIESFKTLSENWRATTLGISALLAAIIGVSCWWAIGLFTAIAFASTPAPSPKVNAASITQSGDIVANAINIHQGANPRQETLRADKLTQEQVDGSFVTTMVLHLDTSKPVRSLYLEVHGRSITQNLEVFPMRSGSFDIGPSGLHKDEGYAFTHKPNPFGPYELSITSSEAEKFEVIYNIE